MVTGLSVPLGPAPGSKPGLQLYSTWHWAHMSTESGLDSRPMARNPSRNVTFFIGFFSLLALSYG